MARRFVADTRVSSLFVILALLAIVFTATASYAAGATSSTTTISSSTSGSSTLGQLVTYTATVTGGAGTPTGQIDFNDGGKFIGSAQLNGSGNATFSTALLVVGYHSLDAHYEGDTTYAVSDSSALPFSVMARPTTIDVVASVNPIAVAAATTITASVSDIATTGPNFAPPGTFNLGNTAPSFNLRSLRSGHAANLLSDGNVLITGGTVAGSPVKTVEAYYSGAGIFTNVTGNLLSPRSGHTTTLLADGLTTLVAGGNDTGDAELYSYDLVMWTGSSALTGPMTAARSGHTATRLGNEVLIVGGTVGGARTNTVEVFTTSGGGTFHSVTGTLAYPRSGHTATLLAQSGSVSTLLIAGGDATGTAELISFDASNNSVTQIGSTTWLTARTGHTATLLPDGATVLFTGGTQAGVPVASAELYQVPSSLAVFTSFVTVGAPSPMHIARTGHTATLLNAGLILLTGGEADTTESVEIYVPSFDPQGFIAIASDDATDVLGAGAGNCNLKPSGSGKTACATTLIPYEVGTPRNITANYISDGNHVNGGPSFLTPALTVIKGTQPTVTVSVPPVASYGQIGLSAVASGGSGTGTYVFSASGGCSVQPNNGVLTITSSTGVCSVSAVRLGDTNYNDSASSSNQSISLTPATLTITADNQTKTYGAALPTFTASYAGFVNGDTSASLATQPTLTTTATAASGVAGSPYPITPSGASIPNYNIVYVAGKLAVSAVPLTITADSKTKVYGAALPALTASYSGFVNGDTSASLTAQPTVTTTATAGSPVPVPPALPYSITASGAVDSNYTIAYVPGTLTVTTAPLTITADSKTKVYGAVLTLTASYSGFVNGDTSASLVTAPIFSTTPIASTFSYVGSYVISASGAVDTNYNISYVPGTLTITQAPATVTPNAATKVYGDVDPTLTGTLSGFFATDNITATYSRTPGETVSGGPYTIGFSLAPSGVLVNYSFDHNATANFTITKATPVISWATPANIVYGTALSPTQLDAVAPNFTFLTTVWSPLPGTFTAYTLGANTSVSGGSASGQPAANAVLDAGSAQQLMVTYNPADALDLTSANKTVAINVSQATPIVTWAPPATIVYGTAITNAQLNAAFNWTVNSVNGPVQGTAVYTLAAGAFIGGKPTGLTANTQVLDAASNQGLLVNFTPTNTLDYTSASLPNSINVTKASTSSYVTVAVKPSASGLTYVLQSRVSSPDVVPVCASNTCPPPTGSVSFFDGSSALAANVALQSVASLDSYASYANTGTAVVTLSSTPAGGSNVAHILTASYDGKDTQGVQGNYLATTATGQNATQILVAPATSVISGNSISPSFVVPIQNWGSAITVNNTAVELDCGVYDTNGSIAPTIPCTLNGQAAALPPVSSGTTVTLNISPVAQVAGLNLKRITSVFAILGAPAVGMLLFGTPASLGSRRRRMLVCLGVGLIIVTLLTLFGCGGGFDNNNKYPIGTGSGTIPGSYFAVVTGTYSTTATVSGKTSVAGTPVKTVLFAVPVQVQ